jgi:hypothetical protein
LGWARVGFIRIKPMQGPGDKRYIGKHLIIIICFEICAILKKRSIGAVLFLILLDFIKFFHGPISFNSIHIEYMVQNSLEI